jgi:uncharacterized lipoprotein
MRTLIIVVALAGVLSGCAVDDSYRQQEQLSR